MYMHHFIVGNVKLYKTWAILNVKTVIVLITKWSIFRQIGVINKSIRLFFGQFFARNDIKVGDTTYQKVEKQA